MSLATEDLGRVVNLVADPELGHMGSDFLDHPGDVVADDRRERHEICVVSATDLKVERVDGGGMDAHSHLAGVDGRYGDVAQLEGIGPSETVEHNGFHRVGHVGVPHRGLGVRRVGAGGPLSVA
jgi:hypothetical protein